MGLLGGGGGGGKSKTKTKHKYRLLLPGTSENPGWVGLGARVIPLEEETTSTTSGGAGGKGGGGMLSSLGSMGGAALGTALLPGIGTAIGGALGGAGGAMLEGSDPGQAALFGGISGAIGGYAGGAKGLGALGSSGAGSAATTAASAAQNGGQPSGLTSMFSNPDTAAASMASQSMEPSYTAPPIDSGFGTQPGEGSVSVFNNPDGYWGGVRNRWKKGGYGNPLAGWGKYYGWGQ